MPDWNAIKAEYITSNISYRKLADKWGVSFRTLSERGTREGWTDERDKHRDNVTKRTVQKVRERQSSNAAAKLLNLQEAADSMGKVISAIFDDTEQFHRHIVQTRDGDTWDADCRLMDKIDTRAIKDLTGALKDLAAVMRNIYDIPTKQEQAAMDNAAERLQLERKKAEADKEDTNEISVEFFTPEEEGWSE